MGLARKADNVRRLDLDKRFGIAAQLDGHHGVCGVVAENLPFFAKFVEGGIGLHLKDDLANVTRGYQSVVVHRAAGAIKFDILYTARGRPRCFSG